MRPVHEMVERNERIREKPLLADFKCVHLGGGRDTTWVIDCDKGTRGERTSNFTSVEAVGGVIFLCNARLSRSYARPMIPEGDARIFVWIYFQAKSL